MYIVDVDVDILPVIYITSVVYLTLQTSQQNLDGVLEERVLQKLTGETGDGNQTGQNLLFCLFVFCSWFIQDYTDLKMFCCVCLFGCLLCCVVCLFVCWVVCLFVRSFVCLYINPSSSTKEYLFVCFPARKKPKQSKQTK